MAAAVVTKRRAAKRVSFCVRFLKEAVFLVSGVVLLCFLFWSSARIARVMFL